MSDGKGKGGINLGQISPAFLFFPLFLVVFIVIGMFGKGGPSAQGASLPQQIQVTNPQVVQLINQLKDYTDPNKFLTANSSQLSTLRAQLVSIQNGINQKQPSFVNLPNGPAIAALCQKMIAEIDQLSSSLTGASHNGATTVATAFLADIKQLNSLAPSGVSCGGAGSKCLDVPVVDQGAGGWCGITSAAMVSLYYTGGQIKDELGKTVGTHSDGSPIVWVKQEGNGKLETGREDFNLVNPSFIQHFSQQADQSKNDWVQVSAPSSSDAFYQELKASIDGGDPVVMYTSPGEFYFAKNGRGFHIVVVVGYNDSTQSIYVNNPKQPAEGGTLKATNVGAGGALLTKDFIYAHNGDAKYGHALNIRRKYLPNGS